MKSKLNQLYFQVKCFLCKSIVREEKTQPPIACVNRNKNDNRKLYHQMGTI